MVSRLEIGLVLVPSMALLQTLEVVCGPVIPELLELLLIQVPSGKSITLNVSQSIDGDCVRCSPI
jgi:hypothetical protein